MSANHRCLRLVLLTTFCLGSLALARGQAQSIEWTRQLGSSTLDSSTSVSADGLGYVYISGVTQGNLGGPNAGSWDVFVSKYNAAGTFQWTRQLGTSFDDRSTDVSADHLGSVYISGYTRGSLNGQNAGFNDAFVSKYDAAGTLQWTRQLGTSSDEQGSAVSADGLGGVYITGSTYGNLGGTQIGNGDVFINKYNASGTLQWARLFGTTAQEGSGGISADGLGNLYVSGATTGSLGGANAGDYDAFVRKYNAEGTLQWTRQLGTSSPDFSRGLSADVLGNVYMSGYTYGSLGGPIAGEYDAFLSKYNAAGTLQWTRQLGTAGPDVSNGVSADGFGNVYISGVTSGSLGGSSAGGYDAFVSKYDAAGTLLWTRHVGTNSFDGSTGVSVDGVGIVYVSGETGGSLGGPNAGKTDAFLTKISSVPEPANWALLLLAGLPLIIRRRPHGAA